MHHTRDFATSLVLRRKFLTVKKSDDQSMQSWIGQIQSQAFTIEEIIGTEVSDQDKILILIIDLPPSYDPVIINFDAAPLESLTFNDVITWLLNKKTCQGSSNRIKNEHEAVFMAKKQVPNWADIICHFCDQKGYYKLECQEKEKWEWSNNQKESANMAVEFLF